MQGRVLRELKKRAIALVTATAVALAMPSVSFFGYDDGSKIAKAADSVAFVNGDFSSTNLEGWGTWIADESGNNYSGSNISVEYKAEDGSDGVGAVGFWFAQTQKGMASIWHKTGITLSKGTYTISYETKNPKNKVKAQLYKGTDDKLGSEQDIVWSDGYVKHTETLTVSTEDTYWFSLRIINDDATWENFVLVDNITITKEPDPDPSSYTKSDLKKLIGSFVTNDLSSASLFSDATAVSTANAKLTSANTVYNDTSATDAQITTAYEELEAALDALTYKSSLFVTKISNYDEDSIRGVDVSSYISIMNAFDVLNTGITDNSKKHGFRDASGNLLDKQGFFNLLARSGVNYVRTRVWVDPKNSSGDTYGGGNNDVTVAKEIAGYVTTAGMENLIDFHLSDCWTDPSKQRAPKAWKNMTVDQKVNAVRDHITSSLTTIESGGAIVSMVQVGNETNNGVAGVTGWDNMNKIFDAGCDAVHNYASSKGRTILAALHFTDPDSVDYEDYASKLAAYDSDSDGTPDGVSYDVFASSYYPFFHGSLSNLQTKLSAVASTYDKYVMVAETSWATTLDDGDGFDNQIRLGKNDKVTTYSFTEQGQADEIRAVANAVNNIGTKLKSGEKAALGFFYWEPAWVPVQNISGLTGSAYQTALAKNMEIWESVGAGWATSYAGEYGDDEKDWYGGSSMDNQSVFDFDARVMDNINIFKYMIYGSTSDTVKAVSYECDTVEIITGETLSLPSKVTVTLNDGEKVYDVPVSWNESERVKVQGSPIGDYTVSGSISAYPELKTVTCSVVVLPQSILGNFDFEDATNTAWEYTDEKVADVATVQINGEDPRRGSKCFHFWKSTAFDIPLSQTISSVSEAGTYKFSCYAMGSDAVVKVKITAPSGTYTVEEELAGYDNWITPEIENIVLSEGDKIVVEFEIIGKAGGYGSIDDIFLYIPKSGSSGNTSSSGGSSGGLSTPSVYIISQNTENETTSDGEVSTTTTKYSDGTEVVNEVVKDPETGAVLETTKTTTSTDSAGNTITVVTSESADGSKLESTKTVAKDGSSKEVSKETASDGTITEKTTTISAAGVTKESSVSTAPNGSTVAINQTTQANGDYTKNTTTTTVDASGKVDEIIIEKETKKSSTVTTTTYEVNNTSKSTVTAIGAETTAKSQIITIPKTVTANGKTYKVTKIAANAYKDNKKATKATIGNNITTIGKAAFKNDAKLKTVTIGTSVKTIGASTFAGDKALKKITINSKNITKVGKNAFMGISTSATISIKGTKKQYNKLVKLIKASGISKKVKFKRIK